MKLISLTQSNLQSVVEATAEAIRAGKVVIAPTDTVYGIIADATNEQAVARIYSIKKRDTGKPLPIFVKNIAMAKKVARVSPAQEKLMEEYWPGKVTLVLCKKEVAKIYGAGDKTIALRIPFYHFINSLLETSNVPLCGTSANVSGMGASCKIDDVLNQFTGAKLLPDLVINAGDLEPSKPSKIIDLTEKEYKVIRG